MGHLWVRVSQDVSSGPRLRERGLSLMMQRGEGGIRDGPPVGEGKPSRFVWAKAEGARLQLDDAVLVQEVLTPLGIIARPPHLHPPLQLHLGPDLPTCQDVHGHRKPSCVPRSTSLSQPWDDIFMMIASLPHLPRSSSSGHNTPPAQIIWL